MLSESGFAPEEIAQPAPTVSPDRKGRHMGLKLSGITVVDLSPFLPGPMMTMMMADQGAEVIKVEPLMQIPRAVRHRLKRGSRYGSATSIAAKQSVALDLKSSEGVAALWALIDRADVFVEGFRPEGDRAAGLRL